MKSKTFRSENTTHYFNDSNRIFRVIDRFRSFYKIFSAVSKKGISEVDLIRSQFPYIFHDASEPPILALELTSYCNLKCLYCTNNTGGRKKEHMNESTFNQVMKNIHSFKFKKRIQLVGNGESTIHPNFEDILNQLTQSGNYISIVTNGNWIRDDIAEIILNSKIDLIEFSIDAGGKDFYEKSRLQGDYNLLLKNVQKTFSLKQKLKSKTLINIRSLLRPSQINQFESEKKFWGKFSDRVMPQYLLKINNTEYNEDLFIPAQQKDDSYPKCSLPFKHMEVKNNGDVLMCYYSLYQLEPAGLPLGNINSSGLNELWNCQIMKNYRKAHRMRNENLMPVCKGCPGT